MLKADPGGIVLRRMMHAGTAIQEYPKNTYVCVEKDRRVQEFATFQTGRNVYQSDIPSWRR